MLTNKQIEQNEQLTENYDCGCDQINEDSVINYMYLKYKLLKEEQSKMVNRIHRGTKE